jgi:tetratricopeptide (TPR) repeat protein
MKKIKVPCRNDDGEEQWVDIRIGEPAPDAHPLKHQAACLARERSLRIQQSVMDSFEKLRDIASQHRLSFEDLCGYALSSKSDKSTTETLLETQTSDALVPEKRDEPWAFWEPSEGDQGTTALARLASSSPAVFADSVLISSRWTRLSFYTDHRLMELHFVRDRGVQRAFVLHGPQHTEWLNESSAPIHDINEIESLALTEPVAADYLKFFLYFLRADDHAAWVPVESSDEVESEAGSGSDHAEDGELLALGDVRAKVRPVLMLREPDPPNDGWVFHATIAYRGVLYSTRMGVAPNGFVEMIDDEPIRALTSVVVPHPPSLRLGRGELLRETSDPEAALRDFDAASDLEPESAEAHCNRATALKIAGRQAESLDEFRAAVRLAPGNASYLRGFVLALIHIDRVDDAVAFADTVTDNADRAAYHNNLGDLLHEFGRDENTVDQYQAAVALAPDNSTYRLDLSNAYLDAGRVEDAIALADTITDNASRAACHAACGDRLRERGSKDQALAQYREAVELAPNDFYRLDLGKALFEAEKVDDAIALADTFINNANQAMYRDQLGDRLRERDKDKALTQYRKAVELAPDNPTYRRDLVAALLDLDKVREVIDLAAKSDHAAFQDDVRDGLRKLAAIDWA